ncbi:hypothetical protein HAHE_08900 [Haloferula helveola]|uniref:Uncharacterized protein n=1 Tax=Haloferula helveola TaxID=490095 RepID=A0ABM7RJ16_9BACT|nr:hypothetical protein HAHE_08900 [Haloferula helveola]
MDPERDPVGAGDEITRQQPGGGARSSGLDTLDDDQPGSGHSVAGPSDRTEWEIFSGNGGWQAKRSQTDQQTSGQALHWA